MQIKAKIIYTKPKLSRNIILTEQKKTLITSLNKKATNIKIILKYLKML